MQAEAVVSVKSQPRSFPRSHRYHVSNFWRNLRTSAADRREYPTNVTAVSVSAELLSHVPKLPNGNSDPITRPLHFAFKLLIAIPPQAQLLSFFQLHFCSLTHSLFVSLFKVLFCLRPLKLLQITLVFKFVAVSCIEARVISSWWVFGPYAKPTQSSVFICPNINQQAEWRLHFV